MCILFKAHQLSLLLICLPGYQLISQPGFRSLSTSPSLHRSLLACGLLRGSEQASPVSLPCSRSQHSSPAIKPASDLPTGGKAVSPRSQGGRLNNAAEFAVAKVDELVNWARKVCDVCNSFYGNKIVTFMMSI